MRTTKRDFAKFQEYCNEYIATLGLNEWSVHYDHSSLDDDYARTYFKVSSGVSTIILNTYWDDLRPKTNSELERLALHEVLHLLTAPLMGAAERRFTTTHEIDAAEHLLIRRLEKLVKIKLEKSS